MRIEVEIPGLPPKKDGANSRRAMEAEARQLMAQVGLRPEVHLVEGDPRLSGDLDNQITGICDGL